MTGTKINLRDKLACFDETWSPRVIGELNGQHVKLAKLQGEYFWHRHEHEDELFMVIRGQLRLELRDGVVDLSPGDVFIVPRGVEHKPVAEELTEVLLFEPATTRNTGDVINERTIEPEDLKRL